MRKGKIISGLLTLALVCTTALPMNINTASAATNTQGNDNAQVEIKEQEPVEITEFDSAGDCDAQAVGEKVEFDKSDVKHFKSRTVIAGTTSDYLNETGDALIYGLSIPAGVYLQAQLTTPANPDLDYDLYLLNAEGYILVGSEYVTNINGTNGTLPEALGYITSGDTATYYLYVRSSKGGSISESFTLDYTVSNACDSFEIDENVSQAKAFTFGTDGASVTARNLSSPVDNDWYKITIPSNRIYDKLSMTATTDSVNKCSVEVYQNIASSGYQMKRVGSGNRVTVSTGTYYIRVCNANSMDEFDDSDIQNYTFTILPLLKATGITITDLKSKHGLNKTATYTGYGTHFQAGSGPLTIYGVAYATDPTTKERYAAEATYVDGLYYSPAWEANNTSSNATRTGFAITNSEGKFEMVIDLPPAIGVEDDAVGTHTHHFDVCGVTVVVSDNTSVRDSETIFHLAYVDTF
ncbi:MAG: hypothetical protein K2K70_14460 [Lachnospiraceae bacterium]|nr:hypothetical protein [Lachnospiraceae bacterium]